MKLLFFFGNMVFSDSVCRDMLITIFFLSFFLLLGAVTVGNNLRFAKLLLLCNELLYKISVVAAVHLSQYLKFSLQTNKYLFVII